MQTAGWGRRVRMWSVLVESRHKGASPVAPHRVRGRVFSLAVWERLRRG